MTYHTCMSFYSYYGTPWLNLLPLKKRLAAAFTAVVTSFVSDIVLPILSLLPFIDRNFDEKFAVLKKGPRYGESGQGYTTMKLALEDGAVVMAYG